MMKTLIAAAVFATASLGSVAHAKDISQADEALVFEDGAAFFGDSFGAKNGGNTFADRFTFSVSGPSYFDALVGSFSSNPNLGLDLTSLDVFTADGDRVAVGSLLSTGSVESRSIHTLLNSGTYFLQVTGTLVSSKGASFSGDVSLQPVPEPATYGMMLAGLGALGFMARRRKS
ncbi:MAG: FxDxF family PEP-CTERM protein [Gammaproteobacteria bacterium]